MTATLRKQLHQQINSLPDGDEIIEPADTDFAANDLKPRSVVRLVEPSTVTARLGRLAPARVERLRPRLGTWFTD